MAYKRFYDREPAVKKAVEALFLFPNDIQTIIATAFALIAEKECKANELLNNVKTLGTDKVLALYKSKQKKRGYDNNPAAHKALNYLMIMSRENQIFLAGKVVELVGCIQDYLKVCKTTSSKPQKESIQTISDTYVQHGSVEAKAFIQQLQVEFKRRAPDISPLPTEPLTAAVPDPAPIVEKPAPKEKTSTLSEAIRTEQAGMRVKGDILD